MASASAKSLLLNDTLVVLERIIDAFERLPPGKRKVVKYIEDAHDPADAFSLSPHLWIKMNEELDEELEATYTDKQRELLHKLKLAEQQPEIYDAVTKKEISIELERSFTAKQKEMMESHKKWEDDYVENYEDNLHTNSCLTVPLTTAEAPDDDAICTLLNAATRIPARKEPYSFDTGAITPPAINMYLHKNDADLKKLVPILKEMGKILQDPSHWKKIKTPRGTAYAIESSPPRSSDDVVLDDLKIVHSLASDLAPKMPTESVVHQYMLDGATVSLDEYLATSPTNGADIKNRILLFGNAAKEILETRLGVDMHKIKETSLKGQTP